jgi:hypothetical protein
MWKMRSAFKWYSLARSASLTGAESMNCTAGFVG